MVHISQLILGKTGCVSYLLCCKIKNEVAIVDAFDGFEAEIEQELKKLKEPSVKYIIEIGRAHV